jgi:beta-lactamase regulating signal transducer with metallopeptidase domain
MHLVTQSALLKALGWALFNSLWQMALLWLCYMLLTAIFGKSSAHIRHGLAVLLLGVGGLWSLMSFISASSVAGSGEPVGGWLAGFNGARQWVNQLLPYCSFIYLLVLAFLFVSYSHHYLHSRRLKTAGLSRIQPALRVFVEQTSLRMGIGKEVRVWLSSLVDGPVTLGFLRPVILIPFATVNNLSLQQVEAILLHELAHIKRYDYLLNLGVTLLGILFFFNPFTRLMIRDIKREREHRCDDLVMQFRYDPHIYASALLSLASPAQNRQALVMAATGRSDRMLLQRVKRILNQKNAKDRPGIRPVIFFLFMVLTGLISLSGPVNRVRRQAQDNNDNAFVAVRRSPLESSSPKILSTPLPAEKSHPLVAPSAVKNKPGDIMEQEAAPDADIYLASSSNPDEGQGSTDNSQDSIAPEASVPTTTVEALGVESDNREYSLSQAPMTINLPATTAVGSGMAMAYVPNSSFSFGYKEDSANSTTPLRELSVLVQNAGQANELKMKIAKAMVSNEACIKKMQIQLNCQLETLRHLQTGEQDQQQGEHITRERNLERSMKFQRVYIQQRKTIQVKLQKVAAKLTIVYI